MSGGAEKYGRLFTEAEVRLLIVKAAADAEMNRHARVRPDEFATGLLREHDENGSAVFPADEPLFLLRASDENAAGALDEYERGLLSWATEPSYDAASDRAAAAVRAFAEWRDAHPDRVKVPD